VPEDRDIECSAKFGITKCRAPHLDDDEQYILILDRPDLFSEERSRELKLLFLSIECDLRNDQRVVTNSIVSDGNSVESGLFQHQTHTFSIKMMDGALGMDFYHKVCVVEERRCCEKNGRVKEESGHPVSVSVNVTVDGAHVHTFFYSGEPHERPSLNWVWEEPNCGLTNHFTIWREDERRYGLKVNRHVWLRKSSTDLR
jgi:hypothetical protein